MRKLSHEMFSLTSRPPANVLSSSACQLTASEIRLTEGVAGSVSDSVFGIAPIFHNASYSPRSLQGTDHHEGSDFQWDVRHGLWLRQKFSKNNSHGGGSQKKGDPRNAELNCFEVPAYIAQLVNNFPFKVRRFHSETDGSRFFTRSARSFLAFLISALCSLVASSVIRMSSISEMTFAADRISRCWRAPSTVSRSRSRNVCAALACVSTTAINERLSTRSLAVMPSRFSFGSPRI